jgi:hypothetical protein
MLLVKKSGVAKKQKSKSIKNSSASAAALQSEKLDQQIAEKKQRLAILDNKIKNIAEKYQRMGFPSLSEEGMQNIVKKLPETNQDKLKKASVAIENDFDKIADSVITQPKKPNKTSMISGHANIKKHLIT